MENVKKYILASQSPRRRELLKQIDLDFDVFAPQVDENINAKSPEELVCELAKLKGKTVSDLYPGRNVISADTVVVVDDKILGKPVDKADAERMLVMLSGKAHKVNTGVCVYYTDLKGVRRNLVQLSTTIVYFSTLSHSDIINYINSGEPMDKAGSYGIQGLGAKFIERIDGDYYGVMGLPLNALSKLLKQAGLE